MTISPTTNDIDELSSLISCSVTDIESGALEVVAIKSF